MNTEGMTAAKKKDMVMEKQPWKLRQNYHYFYLMSFAAEASTIHSPLPCIPFKFGLSCECSSLLVLCDNTCTFSYASIICNVTQHSSRVIHPLFRLSCNAPLEWFIPYLDCHAIHLCFDSSLIWIVMQCSSGVIHPLFGVSCNTPLE